MKTVGLYEAKTKLSALIKELEASGESIALTRHGEVVAEIRLPQISKRTPGCMADPAFMIADDFNKESLGFEEFFSDLDNKLKVAKSKPPQDGSNHE